MLSTLDKAPVIPHRNGGSRRVLLYFGVFLAAFMIVAVSQDTHRVQNAVAATKDIYRGWRGSFESSSHSSPSQPTHKPYVATDIESTTNTTQFNATSTILPPPISTRPPRKAVIASTTDVQANACDWIRDLLPDWEPWIYQIPPGQDKPDVKPLALWKGNVRLEKNIGREASVYLSYLIENYYTLPDYMVFIHGKRYQTHNDEPMYDTFPLIRDLSLENVDEEGYAPLRCNWKECPHVKIRPEYGHHDGFWDVQGLYADAFATFFPNVSIPTEVGAPCCAQFAVTREAVHRLPLETYIRMREWTWASLDASISMKVGIVFEFMWHVIFGKKAYWCPQAKKCFCNTWDLCNLKCRDEGWCHGRLWLRDAPQNFPPNWPEEGQDGDTWPYWGWWEDPKVVMQH